jgi:hypothetical protein
MAKKYCLLIFSILTVGCSTTFDYRERNKKTIESLDVVLCDKEIVAIETLSCREMYRSKSILIAKVHTKTGKDQIKIINLVTFKHLTIPDCKLNGWNVIDDQIALICYFHESNIASGRSLSASEKLNAILLNTTSLLVTNHFELPFAGGIDIELIKVQSTRQHTFCDKTLCLNIGDKYSIYGYELAAKLETGKLLEVVELAVNELGVLSFDQGRYILSKIRDGIVISQEQISKSYNLTYQDGDLSARPILSLRDLVDSFLFDFKRFDENTGLSWGETNTEGRIAWSGFYYWNALSLLSLLDNDYFFRRAIKKRVSLEIEYAFSDQLELEKWMLSKRYSLNRKPMLFMMHLGRAMTVMENIKKRIGYNASRVFEGLEFLLNHAEFNEIFFEKRKLNDPLYWGENNFNSGWFYFKKNIDFWADGLPVPFNFVSAICTEDHHSEILEKQCDSSIKYHEAEVLGFAGEKWRYWPGKMANDGYAEIDNVSTNTPSWDGNKNRVAHDSYLSMDAVALLKRSSDVEVRRLITSMLLDKKLEVDVIPYLDGYEIISFCDEFNSKEFLNESINEIYGAYYFYLRASKFYALSKCLKLNVQLQLDKN